MNINQIIYATIYFTLFSLNNSYSQTNSRVKVQSGYYKPSTGTYVAPHIKTERNRTNHDNYSSQNNYNPYSGSTGYRAKDYSLDAYNYGSGRSIHTGANGGQYYYNNRGNKVYVPKR